MHNRHNLNWTMVNDPKVLMHQNNSIRTILVNTILIHYSYLGKVFIILWLYLTSHHKDEKWKTLRKWTTFIFVTVVSIVVHVFRVFWVFYITHLEKKIKWSQYYIKLVPTLSTNGHNEFFKSIINNKNFCWFLNFANTILILFYSIIWSSEKVLPCNIGFLLDWKNSLIAFWLAHNIF